MIEYATLKLIWWLIIGILMIGYAITDGYDLGSAALLPMIGKSEDDRRSILNIMGPHWDGNQVWLLALGGCIFAGWPQVYATTFSALYVALLLLLYVLILRPLCFEYRAKISLKNKKYCDYGLFIGGVCVPILTGTAMGNLFSGFNFHFDPFLRSYFDLNFCDLLNPLGLLCGVLSLCMIWMHGATWLNLRLSDKTLRSKTVIWAKTLSILVILLFAAGGIWMTQIPGYSIVSIDTNAFSNPLHKNVILQPAGWLMNYTKYPLFIIAPVLGFLGAILTFFTVGRTAWFGFLASSLCLMGIISTAGLSLFPFLLPSKTSPPSSLTLWDATSSYHTLSITTVVACFCIFAIILYTIWSHYKMWRRIGKDVIKKESHTLY